MILDFMPNLDWIEGDPRDCKADAVAVCLLCNSAPFCPGRTPDPCFQGLLPGVNNACCGHGDLGYIQFNNGLVLDFSLNTSDKPIRWNEWLQDRPDDFEAYVEHSNIQQVARQLVVHCKRDHYDVLIDRRTKWGNPYIIGKDGDRAEVIEKYRAYILRTPELLVSLPELQGKILGCWCAPKACHGDVLAELANGASVRPSTCEDEPGPRPHSEPPPD